MKQNIFSIIVIILLVISSATNSLGDDEVVLKFSEPKNHGDFATKKYGNDFKNLIGLEICDDKDEECFKRRLVSEAHLDYIYTQHHPNP